jgi:hypothetical protein
MQLWEVREAITGNRLGKSGLFRDEKTVYKVHKIKNEVIKETKHTGIDVTLETLLLNWSVRISAETKAIVTEVFRGFS